MTAAISPRRPAFVAAVAACCIIGSGDAQAFPDSAYPFPGSNLSPTTLPGAPPDVQHQIAGGPSVGLGSQSAPGWTILPRIDVSEAFNDNIFQTSIQRSSDFITYITPSVEVDGNLPRLQTRLFYAPTGIIYASHGSQDYLAHNLNANASVTVVPDTFFVDLRGYAGTRPTLGGLPGVGGNGLGLTSVNSYGQAGQARAPNVTRNDATQSFSFGIAPYYVHRFGTFGTVKAGYSYSYSESQSLSNRGLASQYGNYGNGSVNTNTEIVQFTSGEDFGRFRDFAFASGTQYIGTGVTDGAYQYIISNQLGYALTRQLTIFGEIGAEDIRFNGVPETKIRDAIWAVGAKYTPNPDSSITVGYGHKYGFDSFLLNAGYALTARTQLFAQYQTGLGTDLTQLQSYTINSDVDQFGNSVDPTTGAPIYLTNTALGVSGNTNLYQNKTFTVTAITNLDRDQISLQAFWQDRQLAASTRTFAATSSSGFSGAVIWRHQINEDTLTNVAFSYGRQNGNQFFAALGNLVENTYAAQASIKYNFTETLSGIAQYTYVDRIANFRALSFTQNVFLLGLSKQF